MDGTTASPYPLLLIWASVIVSFDPAPSPTPFILLLKT